MYWWIVAFDILKICGFWGPHMCREGHRSWMNMRCIRGITCAAWWVSACWMENKDCLCSGAPRCGGDDAVLDEYELLAPLPNLTAVVHKPNSMPTTLSYHCLGKNSKQIQNISTRKVFLS
jgi:hypothetical protein